MRLSLLPVLCLSSLVLSTSIAVQASNDEQFKLLAHNVFLLPSTIKPGWGQQQRAALIAQAAYIQGQDAVILNELFDNPASAVLLDGLRTQYPHQTPYWVVAEPGGMRLLALTRTARQKMAASPLSVAGQ
ncbi:hypothetical protein [Pseudomonas sp.]|jgi:hypothetical protein|uniref:hypothetical protein n=1 Tax=Pseudomonas sp. TaxID=306 RepID=UPI0037C95E91